MIGATTLLRTVGDFRSPIGDELPPDGVHVNHQPYRWDVVSRGSQIAYQVREVPGVFGSPDLAALSPRQHIVIDQEVDRIYGAQLRSYLRGHDVHHSWHVIDGGEEAKTLSEAEWLMLDLLTDGIERRDLVTAVGGGSVCDLAGTVAAWLFKGLPVAIVPTTLTAYIDDGIGTKRMLNLGDHKNAVGAYHEPVAVLQDPALLVSAPNYITAAGVMEALKMALIVGDELWTRLQRSAWQLVRSGCQCDEALPIMRLSIHTMLERLAPNQREHRLARDVDLGHLLVSVLELKAKLPHGLAVGIDLALMCLYSELLGKLSRPERRQVFSLIRSVDAPLCHDLVTPDLVRDAIERTRRHRNGLNLQVPESIGCVVPHQRIEDEAMTEAVLQLRTICDM